MIEVKIDLSRAVQCEIESFLALPGVARALDAMTHAPRLDDDLKLQIAIEPPLNKGWSRDDPGGRV